MKHYEPVIHLDRLPFIIIERINQLDENDRVRALAAEPGSARVERLPDGFLRIWIGWDDAVCLGDLALAALMDDPNSTN